MLSFRSHNVVLALGCALLVAGCMPASEGAKTNNNSSGSGGAGGAGGAGGTSGAGGTGGAGGTSGTSGAGGTGGASGAAGSSSGGTGGAGSGGTGGAGGAGSGGMSGAGAGGTGTSGVGGDDSADVGSYFKSGAWMGYVWTSTSGDGSTITPMDFEAQTTGMPRCVSGTVAAAADFGGTAILGFNLNEVPGGVGMPIAPTMDGVTIQVTNRAGSPLRLQVQTASTGGTQWCTNVIGSGGYITWDKLRTACWGPTGMKYMKEPIVSAMLLVPGDDVDPVDFDFCVEVLAEGDQTMDMGDPDAGVADAGL